MIEALEGFGATLVLAAHLGAAMGAAVDEDPHRAVAAAANQQRPPADVAGDEIAGARDFGFVRRVEPRAIEDPLAFSLQDLGRDEGRAMNPEQSALAVLPHQIPKTIRVHSVSSGTMNSPAWFDDADHTDRSGGLTVSR
jgi:hypothetical protein